MKHLKKVVAVLMLGMMILNLAACSNDEETTSNATGTTSESSSTESAEAVRPAISFMTFDFEGSPLSGEHAAEVIAAMEEHTNTTVDFQFVPSDNYEDKLGLTLASPSDMPMIIAVGSLNSAIVGAAQAGAFWDLGQYISDSEKYPNLSQANANVNASLTVDGQMIGIYRARPIGRYGIGYRADWAEKLGLDVPETAEDLYNMMYQFTYGDPDGNGVDDTYGLALCKYTGPFDIMQTYFGVGNGWVEEDGQLVPVHQTAEYMDALNWFKKMYEDGLVYEDWPVRDTATWSDSVKNGECGMFIDVIDGSRRIWDYFVTNDIPAVEGTSYETATMNLIGTINGKTLATSGYNGFFVVTKAADTEEKLEACLNYLDKMNDSEMITLSSYGLEGISYEYDADGYLVDLDTEDPQAAKAYAALNQTVAYIPNAVGDAVKLQKTDRAILSDEVIASNVEYAVFNPVGPYLINSETYSMNGANLDQIISDARTQYIVGAIDEAGLQSAFDTWASQGGSDIITEVNAQYNK